MLKYLLVAVALGCLLSPAQARHRHRHYDLRGVIFRQDFFGNIFNIQQVPDPRIGRPARYISGRLVCAVNVSEALAERGIRGTDSAAALSYLHWGRSAGGPVPGAVIVSPRRGGGHVALVSRVENGVVYAWNASGGQRGWVEIPYHRRVLDYRVPG
jgi:hypothetical protein